MKRLARRGGLAKRLGVEYIDEAWPYLKVESGVGVARVVGEAKRDSRCDGRVFVRGQVENHGAMCPALFRGATSDVVCLSSAEKEFIAKVGERINVGRFKAPNTAALLQHYGFRTTWLDVLDNLFVAYWFASHKISVKPGGLIEIRKSKAPSGWLFLIQPPAAASVVDLRIEHHPLSARPHVQHGVSITGQLGSFADYREWIVATIRTPVVGSTGGALFTGSALFPSATADHTLKLLLKHTASELAAQVAQAHGLAASALGETSRCADAARLAADSG